MESGRNIDDRRVQAIKDVLNRLQDYFAKLATSRSAADAKKLDERFHLYQAVQNDIESLTSGKQGGMDFTFANFTGACSDRAQSVRGMAGSGSLAAILSEIGRLTPVDQDNLIEAKRILDEDKKRLFARDVTKWCSQDLQSYIENREHQQKQSQLKLSGRQPTDSEAVEQLAERSEAKKPTGQHARFYKDKVVDPELTGRKVALAKDLQCYMQGKDTGGKEMNWTIAEIAKKVLEIDARHKEIISGERGIGKEAEFGGLIQEAKFFIKFHYPDQYAQAKREFLNPVPQYKNR